SRPCQGPGALARFGRAMPDLEPRASPSSGLVSRLAAALAGADAEVALDTALSVLAEVGVVSMAEPDASGWLTLEEAGRTLALSRAPPVLDADVGRIVENLLRAGLRRAAEGQQCR